MRRHARTRILLALVVGALVLAALLTLSPFRGVLDLTWLYFANDFTAARWSGEATHASIAFEHEGHVLVPVRVDDRVTLRFALDTGAPFPGLIGGPHLEGLELRMGTSVSVGGSGSGADLRGRIIRDLDLAVGPVELRGQTAVLIPWQQMWMFFDDPEEIYFQGILGYGLLRRFVVEIDFEREVLTFHRPDGYRYEGDGEVLPLSFSGRKPYVNAEATLLDGAVVPVKLHVDIGQTATLSLIPGSRPEIDVPRGAVTVQGFGLSGRVDKKMARVRELRFGRHRLAGVVTTFPLRGHATGGGRHGLVGLGCLSRFRIILDYPRSRMILERTPHTDLPFEADMSGASFLPRGDGFILKRVRDGSPAADAGLRPGDRLVALNGIPAAELRLRDVRRSLRSGDGVRVRLDVRRGDETTRIELTLRRRI